MSVFTEQPSISESMSMGELMTATAATYHRRGESCPWDCAACPGFNNDEWWDGPPAEPVYLVVTPYGTETFLDKSQAYATARTASAILGKAVTVKKV